MIMDDNSGTYSQQIITIIRWQVILRFAKVRRFNVLNRRKFGFSKLHESISHLSMRVRIEMDGDTIGSTNIKVYCKLHRNANEECIGIVEKSF